MFNSHQVTTDYPDTSFLLRKLIEDQALFEQGYNPDLMPDSKDEGIGLNVIDYDYEGLE